MGNYNKAYAVILIAYKVIRSYARRFEENGPPNHNWSLAIWDNISVAKILSSAIG